MKQLILALTLAGACIFAQDESKIDISSRLEARAAAGRAVNYLLTKQEKDGSFSKHPGITAMAIVALAESERQDEPAVSKAIESARKFVRSKINDNGSVARSPVEEDIYSTSVCLMALRTLGKEEDKEVCKSLRNYLVLSQLRKDGAFGYGNAGANKTQGYPDLSNTHWALEAIRLTKPETSDQSVQKLWKSAREFIPTCQVDKGEDKGGFLYYPVDKQPKKAAHEKTDVVWGSLTLGALKSLLFAGVDKNDETMKAGLDWLGRNYTLKKNPGLGQGGYYYYCYMYASAMLFLRIDELERPNGTAINWRDKLVGELLSRQKEGDHWENENRLWLEGDPVLCTAYALKALRIALME